DLAVGDLLQRLLRAADQGLTVRQPLVLGREGLPLVGPGGEALDLADLPRQALALGIELALARTRIGERRGGLRPGGVRGGKWRGIDAGLLVEQGAHGGGAG